MKVFRSDLSEARSPVITPAGYLQADAYATRAGVFEYQDSAGRITRELRHPDDVFDPESLQTMRLVPVTDLHPPFVVDSTTAQFVSRGSVGDTTERDDDKVAVTVGVTDSSLIERVKQGQRECSMGYFCDVVAEAGTYNGESYDARQKNIRYDHLALVPKGRAGAEVRLRIDGAHSRIDAAHRTDAGNGDPNGDTMKKIMIDGKETEVSEVAAERIEAALVKRDAATEQAKKEAADAKKEIDAQRGRADAAATALEAAKKAHADAVDPTKQREAIQARILLEKQCGQLGVEKVDTLTDSQLKRAAVLKVQPEAKLDDKADEYVGAVFDFVIKERKVDALGNLLGAATPQPGAQQTNDAREDMIKRNAEANKRYLTAS